MRRVPLNRPQARRRRHQPGQFIDARSTLAARSSITTSLPMSSRGAQRLRMQPRRERSRSSRGLTMHRSFPLPRARSPPATKRRETLPRRRCVAVATPGLPRHDPHNGMLASKDEIRLAFKVGGVIATGRDRRRSVPKSLANKRSDQRAGRAGGRLAKTKRDVARGAAVCRQVIGLRTARSTGRGGQAAELRQIQLDTPQSSNAARLQSRRLAEERELVSAGARCSCSARPGFVVRAGLADREIVQVRRRRVRIRSRCPTRHWRRDGCARPTGMACSASRSRSARLPLKSNLVRLTRSCPRRPWRLARLRADQRDRGRRRPQRNLFVLDKDHARRRDMAFIEGIVFHEEYRAGEK